MLPNEAWLRIMKGLSKERKEFKTGSNQLNEIQKTYFAQFAFDRIVIFSMPGMFGYENIEEAIEIDYVEFASVFPMYFSKLRFADPTNPYMQHCKYIFPIIKKFVVDAMNESGNVLEMNDKPKDEEHDKKKKGFLEDA